MAFAYRQLCFAGALVIGLLLSFSSPWLKLGIERNGLAVKTLASSPVPKELTTALQSDAHSLYLAGVSAARAGDPVSAVALLTQARNLDRTPLICFQLGQIYWSLGQRSNAFQVWRACAKHIAPAMHRLARQEGAGVDTLTFILENDPTDAVARNSLVYQLIQRKQLEAAARWALSPAAREPHPLIYLLLAQELRRAKLCQTASEVIRAALQVAPDDARLIFEAELDAKCIAEKSTHK